MVFLDLDWGNDLKLFPTNATLEFFFLMVFDIKMLLDNIYGLLNPGGSISRVIG